MKRLYLLVLAIGVLLFAMWSEAGPPVTTHWKLNADGSVSPKDDRPVSIGATLTLNGPFVFGDCADGEVLLRDSTQTNGWLAASAGSPPYTGASAEASLGYLLSAFRPGSEVGIFRSDVDGTHDAYWLCVGLGTWRYACYEVRKAATNVHALNSIQIRMAAINVDDRDAGIVYVGANFQAAFASYQSTITVLTGSGATATWTTPAGTTAVGLKSYVTTNEGLALVTIDGSTTAANATSPQNNRLTTAQALVDAGTYPNTILVANGGTLNPTDTVIDLYNATPATIDIILADNLSAAAHTVVITATGYKRAASSDIRVMIDGAFYSTASTDMSTANVSMIKIQELSGRLSQAEYVFQLVPTGGAQVVWQGGFHANEVESAFTVTVDGSAATLADGDIDQATSSVVLTKTASLTHPDIGGGSTPIASITCTYTIRPSVGLDVAWTATMLTGGTANTNYPSMLPFGPFLNKASTICATADYTMTSDDNSHSGNGEGNAAWAWSLSDDYALMMYLPDPETATNDWANAVPDKLWLMDEAGSTTNKMYLTRVATGQTPAYAEDDVWTGRAVYKARYFPDGANGTLARR